VPGVSRLLLQVTNTLLALLTIALAGASLVFGTDNAIYTNAVPTIPSLDSNLRFMGGVGLGLGIALLWITPSIEKKGALFRVIWLCALAGGAGRLISAVVVGAPPAPMILFALIEVPGVPLLIYWQHRVARAHAGS
jgi:hypothetical protein